ncbi:MAG TPA: MFS transporter [Streptosporangiaceae bacterium]|nr:MFS transporter [Streptosporangiaceae bacterium]
MTQPSPAGPAAARSGHRTTAVLVLLAATTFAAVTTEMLPVGLLPSISAGLGASESKVGLLVSGYAAVVAVGSIPMAALLERLPRRPVLAALMGTYALSNAVFAASGGYGLALAARLVSGLAHAAFFAVVVSAAVALVPRPRAGRAVAMVMSGTAVALAVGVPAGTALGTALGWRWVFAGSAAGLLLLAVAVGRVLPDTPAAPAAAPRAPERQTVIGALGQPRLLLIAAVIALLMLGQFTAYTYVSPLLMHAGVTREGVSAVLLGYGGAGLAGLALAGSVADRSPRAGLRLTIGLLAACLAGLGLVHATLPTVFIAVVWGLAYGAVPTLTQSGALAAVPAAPDAGPAVVNAMSNVGIAGGALIGARELAAGPVSVLAVTGAALAAAALVLHVSPLPRGRQRDAGRRRLRGGTSDGAAVASSGSRDGGFTSSSRR